MDSKCRDIKVLPRKKGGKKMKPIKELFKKGRIIVLIISLLLALWAISPHPFNHGVAIKSVLKGSAAYDAGIESPKSNALPTSLETINSIDGKDIQSIEDYYKAIENIKINQTMFITTSKKEYALKIKPVYETVTLPELENKTVQEVKNINGTNVTVNKTIQINKTIKKLKGPQPIGLFVEDAPQSNIRYGLDLQGGTRVLLEPEQTNVSAEEMEFIRTSMEQRLNVYGLSNVVPRIIYDKPKALGGRPRYISVEIAGANVNDVKELLAKQGKFEAKVGKKVVFVGGRDIKDVCRRPECSGINPRNPPSLMDNGTWSTGFWFTIAISPDAAKRQAEITDKLSIVTVDEHGKTLPPEAQFLNESIDLYLDNEKIDSLKISKGLKGNAATSIQITGAGFGKTRDQSIREALDNMKKLQTVLITGSLPIKMNIVKADSISPILGKEFSRNALKVGLLAILIVVLIVMYLYREVKISIPMTITMLSEVLLLLGMAALARWDLDLSAIAGIIIAVGTGVDDQIVITDEVIKGKKDLVLTWKDKIKNAFFIIMNSYMTTVVAMIPLLFAGAGLLKGFALTTIAGVTFGVFITRPAFAAIAEHLFK